MKGSWSSLIRRSSTTLAALMLLGLIAVPAALANGDTITTAATMQFSGVVDNGPSCAGATSITINWGDGSATSNGASDANGNVTGTHTYGAQGTYNGTVALVGPNCDDGQPVDDTFTATVKPAPAFKQCPPVGADFGCQFLITASNSGTTIGQDSNQGPYENSDDSLIGLVNNSSDPISSIPLSAPGLFGFESDGLCDPSGAGPNPSGCNYPAGCTAGSTCAFPPPPGQPGAEPGAITGSSQNGYEGPTSYFTNVNATTSNGVVNFSPALQPGQSTYFSLEEPPVSGLTAGGTPGSVGFAARPSVTSGSASFSGFVNPNGAPTTAYFQYGLDARYFKLGASGPVYTNTTPPQAVGGDFSAHTVFATVTGLVPNAIYHARLVATNPSGSTFGADITFKTNMAGLPGPPIFGRSVNVAVVSGLVLIKVNGVFIPLTQLRQIPANAVIDALFGTVKIISALPPGKLKHSRNGAADARKKAVKTQSGKFGGGIFKLSQTRSGGNKGLVTLSLVESAFKGAPTYSSCTPARKAADGPSARKAADGPSAHAAALSRKVLQTLHASAHGKFRIRGRYSAATVRGTVWGVADRCDGTLTRDFTDSVVVTDFVHHKTITLHAGQRYLARARK
jgi:hypothetical protein